jgi:thioester reductase-like protein
VEASSLDTEQSASQAHSVTVLTGATGFLGEAILTRLLVAGEDLILLIRPREGASAQERGEALLDGLIGDPTERERASRSVAFLEADFAQANDELADNVLTAVGARACRIIHGAATVSFDMPLEQARAVNVEGTRALLKVADRLAERGALSQFAFISTAVVAGARDGVAYEHELDVGQEFANTYEQTKFEAEQLVLEFGEHLPITILRPSIVAGDSSTGKTSDFKVLYWPLKVLTRGLVPVIPARRDACYDIVPVDFVADAILYILKTQPPTGKTYHVAAGDSITVQRILELTTEIFEMNRLPPLVSPEFFWKAVRPFLYLTLWGRTRHVMLTSGTLYLTYLGRKMHFDCAETLAALEGSGIAMPQIEKYVETVLRFAKATDFGRQPPPTNGADDPFSASECDDGR